MSRTAKKTRARLRDGTLIAGVLILLMGAGIMYVSYGAQNGLPWEPTYEVDIAVPDAGKLSKNAEVRIGGARVGQVVRITAVPREGDVKPHAVLEVELDKDVGPLPVDTKVEVRLGSVLGGKYVELVPGRSEKTVPEHGTLALENATTTVDIDDAFKVFNPSGRKALRQAIAPLADAVAGRGESLNETFATLAAALPPLNRVLATLVAPGTDLSGFVSGAAAATSALAHVAPVLAPFVSNTMVTLRALDDAGDSLGDTIEELPGAAANTTQALSTLQPVLDDAAALARDLEPVATTLKPTAAELHSTMRTAIRVDPKVGSLASPLDKTLKSLDTFVREPAATNTLKLLGGGDLATFGASALVGLGAVLETTWEAEKHCRVATEWVNHQRSITSDGDAGGNWIRMQPVIALREMLPASKPTDDLHANPYPNANASECEAGNEGNPEGQLIGNPPGLQGAPGGGK